MASTFFKSLALFLVLNLVFFSLVSACGECGGGRGGSGGPKPRPRPRPRPTPYPGTGSSPSGGGGIPVIGGGGIPVIGGGGIPVVGGGVPVVGGGGSGPGPGPGPSCPIDALKLGVCANVLNGLLNVTIGNPPATPCCPLIKGLVDVEAAVCLCTAIRANILGINLNIPLSLTLLVNYCGYNVPRGFQCR